MPAAVLSPPEPDLTPQDMLQRAVAMRDTLRKRQAHCEAIGRLPEETNDEFIKAGFYRILQPRIYGGYEFDLTHFVPVMTEVSRGCPSSGWVLALTSGHPYLLTYVSPEAEREAYGTDGEFRAPGVVVPGAVATAKGGGYVINGGWDYSSGCDVATNFLGHVLLPPSAPGEMPALLFVLINRADFTIVDNWDVVGMRGTGSRRVVVKNVFVPAHRAAPTPFFTRDVLPSAHPNPMYRGGVFSLLMLELGCVAVGTALAALDAYEEILRTKRVSSPLTPLRFEDSTFQQHYARASALIGTAYAALRQCAADYMEFCHRHGAGGAAFSDEEDHRLWLVEQQVTRLAGEAVDLMFRTGGSSAGKSGHPLQRYMRDMMFIRTHVGLQFEGVQENYARAKFGLPTKLGL